MQKQRIWLVLCVAVLAVQFAPPARATWVTERLNLNRYGLQSNGGSWAPSMSADGRYVAWHSWATDLIAGDTDGRYDVYVRDRQQGVSYLVSRTSTGGLENGESLYPSISADGLSIAFSSVATNLVPGDTNGVSDVFVSDWTVGQIERVSVTDTGEGASGLSERASISGDGRFVSFESEASNLNSGGRAYRMIYVHDRLNQTTECASVSSTGAFANNVSYRSAISREGRYVVFTSTASNLVSGDTNGGTDVFLRDRVLGTTERISVADQTGAEGNADSGGPRPAVTPDGRYVAFSSLASNLVPGDTNGTWDVFVRDRANGTTQRVSVSTAGVQGNGNSGYDSYVLAISEDGRYVEFCAAASNLVSGDTNGQPDTFVRDRQLGTTERQSISTAGAQPSLPAGYYGLALSGDGSLRVFDSHAHNLVLNDTSTCINTFLHYATGGAPAAAFSATPTSGAPPLAVQFTDASTGSPTSWSWSFGDNGTAAVQSPAHTYAAAGTYTVSLTATNQYGSNTATKAGYISVTSGSYTLTVTSDPVAGGTVTGGGAYAPGTVVAVTAIPAPGYSFANWTGPVAEASAAATTITMTGNLTVTAHFVMAPASYTLTVNADPAEGGVVTGGGSYAQGAVANVTATPAAGYTFSGWTGPVADPSATSTTVTVTSDLTVSAHFAAVPVTLTVIADPVGGGTVTGDGSYVQGSVVTVTAAPASGSFFANWTGPVASAEAASTTVTMTGSLTVTAHFYPVWREDTDPPIAYSGAWTVVSSAIATAGHFKSSARKNAQATLTFTGRGISWHAVKGPAMGKAKVIIDGGKPVLIDLYAATEGVATFATSGLAAGKHTVIVRVAGQKNAASMGMAVTVDALEVTP